MQRKLDRSGPVLGVSVCVVKDGCVLLTQRGKPPFEDRWSLPGGHVEAGERLEAAALREAEEETGLRPELKGLFEWSEIIDEGRHYVVAVFLARWTGGEAKPQADAKAVRWVSPHELATLEVTPGLDRIVAKALLG